MRSPKERWQYRQKIGICQLAVFFKDAARGIRGDRFFDHKENYKGQITFFAVEVYEEVCRALGIHGKSAAVLRRNVVTEGVNLNALIGREFELQGVRFRGMEECSPCYWMNTALAPGAEILMKGRGGLRAAILTDGCLRSEREPMVGVGRQHTKCAPGFD